MRAPERTTSAPPRRGGRARERGGRCPPGLGHRPAAAGAHGPRAPGMVCGSRSGPGGARARRGLPAPSPPPFPPTELRAGVRGSLGRNAWCIFFGSGLGCRRDAELFGLARGEARRELGGLASAPPGGRLHLLSESLSHVCGRCSCPGGGGAGLGAIIWEDAVPCPAGAVVSPLKKPAPHCSRAAEAGSRGRPAPRGEEGAAAPAPAPGRCPPAQALPGGVPRRKSGSSQRAATGGGPRRPGPGRTAKTAVLSRPDGQRSFRSRHAVA